MILPVHLNLLWLLEKESKLKRLTMKIKSNGRRPLKEKKSKFFTFLTFQYRYMYYIIYFFLFAWLIHIKHRAFLRSTLMSDFFFTPFPCCSRHLRHMPHTALRVLPPSHARRRVFYGISTPFTSQGEPTNRGQTVAHEVCWCSKTKRGNECAIFIQVEKYCC